jgi:hypothetical protein
MQKAAERGGKADLCDGYGRRLRGSRIGFLFSLPSSSWLPFTFRLPTTAGTLLFFLLTAKFSTLSLSIMPRHGRLQFSNALQLDHKTCKLDSKKRVEQRKFRVHKMLRKMSKNINRTNKLNGEGEMSVYLSGLSIALWTFLLLILCWMEERKLDWK